MVTKMSTRVLEPTSVMKTIKRDVGGKVKGLTASKEELKYEDLEETKKRISELTKVISNDIFSGASDAPHRVLAQELRVAYKPELKNWYKLLMFDQQACRNYSRVTKTILRALSNEKLVKVYPRDLESELHVECHKGRIVYCSNFTDRFSFNYVGIEYLKSRIETFDSQCLLLSPRTTCNFVSEMNEYLLEKSKVKPLMFEADELMGELITESIQKFLFTEKHISLVSDDLLLLTLGARETIDYHEIEKTYHILGMNKVAAKARVDAGY